MRRAYTTGDRGSRSSWQEYPISVQAHLNGAYLNNADFSEADLTDAALDGAILDGVIGYKP
jgi:uncharacterized protein YjbI with pentapeptide repeats